eukprot:GHRQ01018473.1.p1 GENE.GHRQ01018473.1~~GHRQ01018473.1.p1  ORF type:complete len:207 (+),score=45.35 GHRQ01018473.1:372-992(+)
MCGKYCIAAFSWFHRRAVCDWWLDSFAGWAAGTGGGIARACLLVSSQWRPAACAFMQLSRMSVLSNCCSAGSEVGIATAAAAAAAAAAARYDDWGRPKRSKSSNEDDRRAREQAALARLYGGGSLAPSELVSQHASRRCLGFGTSPCQSWSGGMRAAVVLGFGTSHFSAALGAGWAACSLKVWRLGSVRQALLGLSHEAACCQVVS